MSHATKRHLTPSQQRLFDAQHDADSMLWHEWLVVATTLCLMGSVVLWIGMQVYNFATSSPMTRSLMQ